MNSTWGGGLTAGLLYLPACVLLCREAYTDSRWAHQERFCTDSYAAGTPHMHIPRHTHAHATPPPKKSSYIPDTYNPKTYHYCCNNDDNVDASVQSRAADDPPLGPPPLPPRPPRRCCSAPASTSSFPRPSALPGPQRPHPPHHASLCQPSPRKAPALAGERQAGECLR